MAESGIYEIVNLVNGKRYVGSSVDLSRRLRVHRRHLVVGTHHNARLQRAWKKYGPEAFDFRVVLLCGTESLIEQEQAAIDRLKPEYNLSPTAGNLLGFRLTDEQRAACKGRKQTEEWVQKRSQSHVGAKRSEETRRRISEAMTGKKHKTPRSAETRAKLSEAMKARPENPERVAKMAATKRGSTLTEEHKRRIGEASKLMWAKRKAAAS